MSTQMPAMFEIKSGTTKEGKACMVISMDTEEIHQHLVELVNCLAQASFIPEVEVQHISGTMWRYDVINVVNTEHSRRDVYIDHLQEALIEVIASVSLDKAKKRTPAPVRKKAPARRRTTAIRSVK